MSKKIALLFPGQGSQSVGMGKDIFEAHPEAKAVFQEADAVLGFDLSGICFNGPDDELKKTHITQPAILTHSVAVLRLLQKADLQPVFAAGHSLGEYSAHVAAGSLSFADALRAVRLRGELMYRSGEERPGTMAAILGLAPEKVAEVCAEAASVGICQPANFNSPEQTVISGEIAAVKKGMELALIKGASKAVQLEVSGAFHSALMRVAKQGLAEKLNQADIRDATFPVIANYTAQPVRQAAEICATLIEQLDHPVRWIETIQLLANAGVELFIEVGPGKVLCGLMRRIDRSLTAVPTSSLKDLEKALEHLKN